MHKIPKKITIKECERLLSSLEQDVEDLELVWDWSNIAFSGIATAIQAAITWGRRTTNRTLLLPRTKKPLGSQIEDLVDRPPKFVAAMFAQSILSRGEGAPEDVRGNVNLTAKSKIVTQQRSKYGQQRGGLCWFAFVDHSTLGFDQNFYITQAGYKPRPRIQKQLEAVIHSMIQRSGETPGGAIPLADETKSLIGRMFYELFLNTHQHGSRSKNREEWLRPGVRVIYTNGINLTAVGAQETVKDEPVLSRYVDRDCGKTRYMEISVVDSGMGYFERWMSDHGEGDLQPSSLEDEYGVFKKCFSFRQGSTGKDEKGNGLPVVMERLTQLKGFMRVRSGRLSLYRNFIDSPYAGDELCYFYDWLSKSKAEEKLTKMPKVEGVAITLLIPLEGKQ